MADDLRPSMEVGIRLASLAVHAEEFLSEEGRPKDAGAIEGLLADPEVREYLARLDAVAMLPVKRGAA